MSKPVKVVAGAAIEPVKLAQLAHLRYVCDADPGIMRKRKGAGFYFFNARGKPVRDARHLERIAKLAIPPAWENVWIAGSADAHLQATGHDQRGRKQYLYHARWSEVANLAKFWRLSQFGRVLPRLRAAVVRDLRRRNLPRDRVVAGVVGILDATSIRVGNEEYATVNHSYGLTTLRDRHVAIIGRKARLRFRAKGQLERDITIASKPLVTVLDQCRRLPGRHVFQYMNGDAKARMLTAADVNEYLRSITGQCFTAKDFRTWKASSRLTAALLKQAEPATLAGRKRVLKSAIVEAAELLGNTPTVCSKYYVHPALAESYLDGKFTKLLADFRPRRSKWLQPDEQAFMYFLRKWERSWTGNAPSSRWRKSRA